MKEKDNKKTKYWNKLLPVWRQQYFQKNSRNN